MIASTPADYKPHARWRQTGDLKRSIPMCLLGMLVCLMTVRDAAAGTLEFDPARTIVSDANNWWAKDLEDINGNGRLLQRDRRFSVHDAHQPHRLWHPLGATCEFRQTPTLPVSRPANDATREKQIPFRRTETVVELPDRFR